MIPATLLLVGGLCWSLVCLFAASMQPQADFGAVMYLGPLAAVAGLLWWVSIIWGWLA